jgi:hypothetical protein
MPDKASSKAKCGLDSRPFLHISFSQASEGIWILQPAGIGVNDTLAGRDCDPERCIRRAATARTDVSFAAVDRQSDVMQLVGTDGAPCFFFEQPARDNYPLGETVFPSPSTGRHP